MAANVPRRANDSARKADGSAFSVGCRSAVVEILAFVISESSGSYQFVKSLAASGQYNARDLKKPVKIKGKIKKGGEINKD